MNGIKPPYKVPLMKEIELIPWNGYNVVSTFSGGGGSCLGYRMAGYRVLWANEFVNEAQKTYLANHPGTILDTRDIRQVQPQDILEAIGMKVGEIDLFDGSPPCCAFSMSGRRENRWNEERKYSDGKVQRIEDLFFEYIRILDGLQPRCFIAENVSGLIKGTAIGYFKEILAKMNRCGYVVKAQLLNAKWLGVPQSRERIIFIGVRNDLNIEPVFPRPYKYQYTIRDAFEGIVIDEEERKMCLDKMAKSMAGIYVRQMPKDPEKMVSGRDIRGHGYFNLQRWPYDKPIGTICQSHGANTCAANVHPTEDRNLTINEVKRVMSVPDDFILTGSYAQKYERLGRMVPPVMMMNIAKTVQEGVLDRI